MAKLFHLILLLITIGCANSVRILDELTPQYTLPTAPGAPEDTIGSDVPPVVPPSAALPSDEIPAATTPIVATAPPVDAPVVASAGVATPAAKTGTESGENAKGEHPTLSFFMHDILGGSHPSGRVVTGVVATTNANNLPFSKANSQVFPINGGVPLNSINGIINNNNFPILAGLNGQQTNLQNNGNNDVASSGGNQPFVTAGNLPSGLSLQELMFGSITVVDNELTEGHELGTGVIGKAQGFYVASSQDGSSHTLALTAFFHGGEHHGNGVEDTISFFGVHRTATPISHLAIIGGTGAYENAKGHAIIETELHQENQHTTDGVETITHFTVFITP
ncbi:hypothetical protein LIER_27963 [Lithospermum erythrorhizon]|uniref:Dirigent protein n=1 Tax=Lithospermum erythrorhizon TaxID=34254 RepID=A0AAV3RI01_LITER